MVERRVEMMAGMMVVMTDQMMAGMMVEKLA